MWQETGLKTIKEDNGFEMFGSYWSSSGSQGA